MKRYKQWITAVLLGSLLAGPGSVLAAQWYWLQSTDEASYYMDIDSIRRQGDTVQAWTKVVHEDGNETQYLFEFYPKTRQYTILKRVINADSAGFMTQEFYGSHAVPPKNIVPGTVQEAMLKLF